MKDRTLLLRGARRRVQDLGSIPLHLEQLTPSETANLLNNKLVRKTKTGEVTYGDSLSNVHRLRRRARQQLLEIENGIKSQQNTKNCSEDFAGSSSSNTSGDLQYRSISIANFCPVSSSRRSTSKYFEFCPEWTS
jgi:hypothetical protein